MKKLISMMLCLSMMLLPTAAVLAEEAETSFTGAWYADLDGIPIQMTIEEDGVYSLQFPGEEPVSGTWEMQENFYLCLDGEQPPEVMILNDRLKWTNTTVFFSREAADRSYKPAEVNGEPTGDMYNGYWKCAYVDVGGTPAPAATMHDITDLYIEGSSAILGGPAFGDALVRMSFENGEMICENNGSSVQLQMQEDTLLRMTVTEADGTIKTRYLTPAYSPFLDEDGEEEE